MSTEVSLADLTTPILPETASGSVKNNLSRKDICNVISGITNILETVQQRLARTEGKINRKISRSRQLQELKALCFKKMWKLQREEQIDKYYSHTRIRKSKPEK